jgi:peptidoglycan/LPS O-acetylase OafA/YrhL
MGEFPPARPVDPVEGYRPRYRSDIDGLRAIAVVAVILYHFWGQALPGGFLGVDVFFVISGFLITRILVRENEAGDYSILRFYDRRVRRIMPALLVMMAATTVFVWLIYLPVDATAYAKSVVATLAFLSNVYFWRDGIAYFSSDGITKPLLHTWSLGIEEQFYILFPILVWLLMKLGGRRFTFAGILTITAISFALATAAAALNTSVVLSNPLRMNAWDVGVAAFYLLPARAWELGLGAGVALLRETPGTDGSRVRAVLSAAAFALLLASLILLKPLSYTPLPPPTFACAATTLLIRLGQRDNAVAGLLGAKRLVATGLASYSLYLWHWPVYVLGRYFLIREPTAGELVAMLALTGALAALSWRYVERPFRSHRMPTPRVLTIVVTLGGAVAAAAAFLLATRGAPGRFPQQVLDYDAAMSVRFQCPSADRVPFGGINGCLIGAPGKNASRADVVLFGNSHAEMYAPAVEPILARRGLKGQMVSTGGCLPITAFNTSHECIALMRNAIEAVARLPDARVVIIGSTWPRDIRLVDASGRRVPAPSWPQYLAAVQQTLDRFARAGKHVILVGPTPWPGYNSTSVAARELAFRGHIETPLAQSRGAYDARFAPLEQWLGTLEPKVTIVRPSALMCDRARCSFRLGGKPAYFDDNHLSVFVMPAFEPSFDRALDKALPPSKRSD